MNKAENAVVGTAGGERGGKGQSERFPGLTLNLQFPQFAIRLFDLQKQFFFRCGVLAVIDQVAQRTAVD